MTVAVTTAKIGQPFKQFASYLRESVVELRQVAWPTRSQTAQYTLVVTVAVLVVVALTAALDYGLSTLFERIIERRGLS
jgi:preprotein translocase SecE subunit